MRRTYVRPAVVTEDRVEQTSLACNATQPYPLAAGIDEFPGAGAFAPGTSLNGCTTNVAKGLNFANANVCEIAVEGPSSVVVLS
jgi:hypothetical protein